MGTRLIVPCVQPRSQDFFPFLKRETVLGTRLPCVLSLFSCHEQDGDSLSLGSHQTSAKCVDDQPSRWSQNNFFFQQVHKARVYFIFEEGGRKVLQNKKHRVQRTEGKDILQTSERKFRQNVLLDPPPPPKKSRTETGAHRVLTENCPSLPAPFT